MKAVRTILRKLLCIDQNSPPLPPVNGGDEEPPVNGGEGGDFVPIHHGPEPGGGLAMTMGAIVVAGRSSCEVI